MRLNGVDQADTESLADLETSTAAFLLFGTVNQFEGNLDEVSIWNLEVSDDESDRIKTDGVDAGGLP